MILPDVNLLIYAYNLDAPNNQKAQLWWEDCLSGNTRVGLPWVVMLGFLRLMTNRSVLDLPMEPAEALGEIRAWLERPNVQIVQPGSQHVDLLDNLAKEAGTAGKLTTDLHLAALAIEHQAELHSTDTDFGRFSGLRWMQPLR